MSDLSRMLNDVYGTTEADPDGEKEESPGAPPAWADESVLDQAFASWVPGPPTSAPEAERTMLSEDAPEGETADWLTAPEGASPQDSSLAALETGTPRWSRDADDLLPPSRRSSRSPFRR